MPNHLIPERMAKNYMQYKYMRQAAGLPFMGQPDVLTLDQNPTNAATAGTKTAIGVAVGIAIVILLMFSFRIERRRGK